MLFDVFGYDGIGKRDDDTFTWTAGPTEVFAILASDYVFTQFPAFRKPTPVNSGDYDELVGNKEVNPKKIKRIRLITDNFNQLEKPFQWIKRDSNGEALTFLDFPINLLAPDQFQSRVIDIDYENLILGQNEYLLFEVFAGTTITMTFEYDDIKLSSLLDLRYRK